MVHPGAAGHVGSAWQPHCPAPVVLRAVQTWGLWETAGKQVSEAVVRVEKRKQNTNHTGRF